MSYDLEGFLRLDSSGFVAGATEASAANEEIEESSEDAADEVNDLGGDIDRTERKSLSMGSVLAGSLAPSLSRVDDEAEEADDSVSSLNRTVSGGSARMGTFAASVGATALALTGISAASTGATASLTSFATTVGTLTTAAFLLTAALAPLASTLGGIATAGVGLAGAFGAVVGSGMLAYGKDLTEQNKQRLRQVRAKIRAIEQLEDRQGSLTDQQRRRLRQLEEQEKKLDDATGSLGALELAFTETAKSLQPLIVGFGQQFTPLVEDAVDAVKPLARNILAATGDLTAFKNALRGFGQSAFRLLPGITDRLFDLGREALPLVVDAGQWLATNGGDLFAGMMRTTRRIAPLLFGVGRAFASIAPEINRIGTAMLQVGLPALENFLGAFEKLLQGDIEGGLIQPLQGMIQDTVSWLNSGEGRRLLDDVSAGVFNTLADALSGTEGGEMSEGINALGGAIGDSLEILTQNFEESGLGGAIGSFATKLMQRIGRSTTAYVNSEEGQEQLANISGAILGSFVDTLKSSVSQSVSGFNLTGFVAGSIVKGAAGLRNDALGQDSSSSAPASGNTTSESTNPPLAQTGTSIQIAGAQAVYEGLSRASDLFQTDVNLDINDRALKDLIDARIDKKVA